MLRILFTTVAATGHFHPLVPLARAAQASGHSVAFACPPSFMAEVTAGGFRAFPAVRDLRVGSPDIAADAEARDLFAHAGQLPPGPETNRFFNVGIFYNLSPRRMVPDLLALCNDWRPDLIVRESMELGGALAAEVLGLPHAGVEVAYLAHIAPWREAIHEQVDRIRRDLGLSPDPALEMLYRYLHLSFTPARFHDPATPLPATLHALHSRGFDGAADAEVPAWLTSLPGQPTVYVTLGTVMNQIPGIYPRVLRAILAGLRDEPLNIVVTVGKDKDPAELETQPSNVHVARYIPQSQILPYCDLLVTHGGHNTILAAIDAGLPLVVVPFLSDQPDNARRCAELGLGRIIAPPNLNPQAVRDAVRAAMMEPSYRDNMRLMRAEMRALPGPDHGVRLLEQLVSARTPLHAAS